MEPDIRTQLEEQRKVMEEVLASMEKTRTYMRVMMWIGIGTVLLPFIGLLFVVPWFLNTYMQSFEGLL